MGIRFLTKAPVAEWLELVSAVRGRYWFEFWSIYVGLPGNEKADTVAKWASLHPTSDTVSQPLQDLYPSIVRAVRESW